MSSHMGVNNLFNFMAFFNVGINFLIATFLVKSVLSVDSRYDTCKPINCGTGPNISYPFYVYDAGTDYCGYPGLVIGCDEHKPTYLTSLSRYTIKDISYENQSLWLVNEELISSTNCYAPLGEFTLDRSSLQFSPYHAYLLFFYNCTDSFSFNYTTSSISCDSSPMKNASVALVPGNYKDCDWTANGSCNHSVLAPVELEEGRLNLTINDVDYPKLLNDGFTLKWIGVYDCVRCQKSGGRCGFENGTSLCFCPDGSSQLKDCNDGNGKDKMKLWLGLGIVGLAIPIIVISSIYIIRRRRYKRKHSSAKFLSSNTPSDPSSKSDLEGGSVYFGVPIFSHSELEEATNNFDSEKELGDGGFGIVYRGKLRDGREVAVKRLFEHNYRRAEQFMNEIEILTRLRHKNLVTLYGCTSRRSRDLLLVYEYIPNGTVADHLHGEQAKPNSLTWPIRMNIAVETASALAYLHKSDTIHRDVKTNNILLDNNFSVKVADFGLSRLFPSNVTHVSTAPQGTPGYVDPDYHQCYQLTDRSDVYSFGVVLIELISSMPAVDIRRHRHEINLANFAINKIQKCAFDELIDPCLGHQSDEEVRRMTTSVAELAFRCLQQDKEMRPSMAEVLEELQRIQSGEYKLQDSEGHENNDVVQREQPPPSPPECDEVSLLKNIRLPPPSPISVTDKWISSNTTPNASG